ncbi:hypothetical protein MRX96_033858 [Rhipicephalus microplus]
MAARIEDEREYCAAVHPAGRVRRSYKVPAHPELRLRRIPFHPNVSFLLPRLLFVDGRGTLADDCPNRFKVAAAIGQEIPLWTCVRDWKRSQT